jgi:hypothetical protein
MTLRFYSPKIVTTEFYANARPMDESTSQSLVQARQASRSASPRPSGVTAGPAVPSAGGNAEGR